MLGLDYSDERYARLYTRDTPEWHVLTWQAKAVYCLLRRKVDRSGVVPLGRGGLRAVSALVGVPGDVGEPAMRELADSGYLDINAARVAVVEFVESETAVKSDALRQAESRARRGASNVTKRDTESRNVTESHAESHAVTESHMASQNVTLYLTDPCLTDPDLTDQNLPPCPPSGGSAPAFALDATTTTKAPRSKREPRRAGTRTAMDPEFGPTPANVELAVSLGLDADDERRKFLLHHAKHGNMFVSWPAAFASWLLKAREFAPRASGNGPVLQKSAAEYDGSSFDRLPWVVRAKAEAEAEAEERKQADG